MSCKDYGEFLDTNNVASVAIDKVHSAVLYGTILALKPKYVLELGVGSGFASMTILHGLSYNNKGSLTCVDSWWDWKKGSSIVPGWELTDEDIASGKIPPIGKYLISLGVKVISSTEKDYLEATTDTFDLIVVDSDHGFGHERVNDIYDMCNPGGVVFSHDIYQNPNLKEYIYEAKRRGWGYKVYDQNSLPGERCQRGFIQVFKPDLEV